MGFRKKKIPPQAAPAQAVQLRDSSHQPFSCLEGYTPLREGELRLYRAIREAVPVVDAAIYKIIRMVGGVQVRCEDPAADAAMKRFLREVPTGRGQQGFESFLECYLDSLLTCGRAVGEIVPTADGRGIAAVFCGDVEEVEIREGSSPLDFTLCGRDGMGQLQPFPYPKLLLFTPFHPEEAHPYGVSMLRSLPFVTEVLMKIYHTIGTNWERCGNTRFAVIYKPGDSEAERGLARERSEQIAKEWSAAMQQTRGGCVRDFVAVGDVEIRVIGADNQILDSEIPVRQLMEQIVACTGIPPFLLGLSWSSTERMSAQQADLLTTEMTAIRRTLTPMVEKVCRLFLQLHGLPDAFVVEWDAINLQDQVEEAKAELYRQQARKLCLENDALEATKGVTP